MSIEVHPHDMDTLRLIAKDMKPPLQTHPESSLDLAPIIYMPRHPFQMVPVYEQNELRTYHWLKQSILLPSFGGAYEYWIRFEFGS